MQKSSLDAEEYVQDEIQKQVLVCVLTEKAGMDAFCHCKNFIDQTPYSVSCIGDFVTYFLNSVSITSHNFIWYCVCS